MKNATRARLFSALLAVTTSLAAVALTTGCATDNFGQSWQERQARQNEQMTNWIFSQGQAQRGTRTDFACMQRCQASGSFVTYCQSKCSY